MDDASIGDLSKRKLIRKVRPNLSISTASSNEQSINVKKHFRDNEIEKNTGTRENDNNGSEKLFDDIVGYDDVKLIFNYAINSSLPVHILLVGPPGSAKTLFMLEIMKLERSYFTLGSHSTKAGMIDYLFTNRPRNLIIDEIEYMPIKDQAALLSLMETGILSETKFEKTRNSLLKTWIFASCNNEKKLMTPLLSRFVVLYFKKYDYQTFKKISNHMLLKECNHEKDLSDYISSLVWNKLKSRDIRDCIKIGRLSKNFSDVDIVINTIRKYSLSNSIDSSGISNY